MSYLTSATGVALLFTEIIGEGKEKSEQDEETEKCDDPPDTDRGRTRDDKRFLDYEDAIDQLEGVESEQAKKRKRGDPTAPDFTDKSKERAKDFLRKTFTRRRGGKD